MGCVQSQESLSTRKRFAKATPEMMAPPTSVAATPAAPVAPAAPAAPAPRDTAVLKQACVFDQLHAEAHAPPRLEQVTVNVGKRSSLILEGFEKKEAAARAPPQLVAVNSTDLAQSKLYDKLRGFEEKDARAAEEVRIDKGLVDKDTPRMADALQSPPAESAPVQGVGLPQSAHAHAVPAQNAQPQPQPIQGQPV